MLGCVERGNERGHRLDPVEQPAGGENQTPSVSYAVAGSSSGSVPMTLPSAIALRWKPTTCSETSRRP